MYYCHLPVSHLAMYAGDRLVAHTTTDRGVVKQRIDDLFDRGLRFLPCRMMLGGKRKLLAKEIDSWIDTPYTYRNVVRAWLYIISGRNWATFKWRFYFDFLIIYICFGLLTFSSVGWALISSLALVHLAMILVFALLWKYRPIPFDFRGASLNMSFALFYNNGMLPLTNGISKIDDVEILAVYREKD